jgi:hypothetical protein
LLGYFYGGVKQWYAMQMWISKVTWQISWYFKKYVKYNLTIPLKATSFSSNLLSKWRKSILSTQLPSLWLCETKKSYL